MNETLRKNSIRAKVALLMIGIVLLSEAIALVSSFMQLNLLDQLSNGLFVSESTIEQNDLRQQIISIFYLVVFLISGITFICWFRRAYFNLHLKADELSYSEGWASGGWFVPIVNLSRPYKIMKELHLETNNLLTKKGEFSSSHINLISLWWTLWIINLIVSNISFRLFPNPQTIEDFQGSTIALMTAHAVGIPLAIVTMIMIIKQSEIEDKFAQVFSEP